MHAKAAAPASSHTAHASHGFFDSSVDESFYSILLEPSIEAPKEKHAFSLVASSIYIDASTVKASKPTEENHAPPPPTQSIIEGANNNDEGHDPIAPVSFFRMLSAASNKWDVLLMIAGSIGAVCFGLIQPGFFIFFGQMINAAGTIADDPKALAHQLAKVLQFYLVQMHIRMHP